MSETTLRAVKMMGKIWIEDGRGNTMTVATARLIYGEDKLADVARAALNGEDETAAWRGIMMQKMRRTATEALREAKLKEGQGDA